MEIYDSLPHNYPEFMKKYCLNAENITQKNLNEMIEYKGCNAISLKLSGCHPDNNDWGSDKAVENVWKIINITDLPVIVSATGINEKDIIILKELSEKFSGMNLTLGNVTMENYQEISESVSKCGHNVIAETPIDINLAKQLNILLSENQIGVNRILSLTTSAVIGYGFEYSFSTIERIKLAQAQNDRFLMTPQISWITQDVWKIKEAVSSDATINERISVIWESATAAGYIMAGSDIVVMHNPLAIRDTVKFIQTLFNLIF